ncbi:mechanosensitive ion channel domain-containing protein [Phenylobacterium sp.]|uniref:mechanosensitive ion channel family protein n=1 Tax=Phenylobacterium sp. TaxID=1871053 RepID=UPI00286E559D|nr:mechanosensitive ion channel domain-containing protein [Phenylobacterium sp.]
MSFETAKAAPAAPLTRAIDAAVSGDPEMLRGLAAVMASFSVRIVVAILILAITLWAAKRVAHVTERGMQRLSRHTPADKTLAHFASALVKYVIIAIGLIAVLQQLGVQTTSVLAVLGAASLAIGLALQGTLSNVAAGVMILLQRPYRVGDRVELNGRQGVVSGLDLFNTRLLDYDGLTVYLPNAKVFGDMIVNVSQAGRRRIDLVFGIDYEDDLDLALDLLLKVAGQDERVLSSPAPWSKVTTLADSSVSVSLRCWATPDDWMDTRFDLVKQVKETFEAHGLSFPYPHQVAVERSQRAKEDAEASA